MKKRLKSRPWPAKRRAAQAARCKAQKPWAKSTGPRTDDGKNACKNNALKHGLYTDAGAKLKVLLHEQKIFVKTALEQAMTEVILILK
jgi:hypothetical protein